MYDAYIHASRSRIIDVCIIHTCIKIKDHRCMDTCIMDTSAWVTRPERPKGAKDEVKGGPKGRTLEVGAQRAPKLLVLHIFGEKYAFSGFEV